MSKFDVGDAVVVNQRGGDGALGIEENFPFTSAVTSVLGAEEYYVQNTSGKGTWWVYGDMLSPLISEVASEVKSAEPVVSIWTDHLGDISRALNILTDAMKAMNADYHDSDLEFRLDGKIRAEIYGEPTGWVLAYDPDSEAYMFQVEA